MDWGKAHDHAHRKPPPPIELLERCWRLRATATGREIVCGIFQTAAGLEVRAGYRDDLIHSQWAPDLETARAIATAFKLTLVDEFGAGEELPLDESAS